MEFKSLCVSWCLNNASSVYWQTQIRIQRKKFPYKPTNPELILTGDIENYAEVACHKHKSVQIASTQQTTILGFFLHRLERGLAVIWSYYRPQEASELQ
jgi:hypothetical protein